MNGSDLEREFKAILAIDSGIGELVLDGTIPADLWKLPPGEIFLWLETALADLDAKMDADGERMNALEAEVLRRKREGR